MDEGELDEQTLLAQSKGILDQKGGDMAGSLRLAFAADPDRSADFMVRLTLTAQYGTTATARALAKQLLAVLQPNASPH